MTPIIASFNPLTAFAGEKVTISGSGFTGVTAVKFGGYDALTFRVVSDTTIEAYYGLDGTGVLSVTNADGTGSLGGFTQQKIKKKIPDFPALGRTAVPGDKVLMWADAEAATRYADINDLPAGTGSGGGGGTTTQLGSPFAVRITDPSYSYTLPGVDPAYPNGKAVITDIRLVGKTDYAVVATQYGGNEIDDNLLSYDSAAGKVTIDGFQLDPTAKLRIYADGVVNNTLTTFISNLSNEIATLKNMLSPFVPTALGASGAAVWYTGDMALLAGTGWQECVAMRGHLPMGIDPDDVFDATTNPNGLPNTAGIKFGSKFFKLKSTDQLPKFKLFTVVNEFLNHGDHPNSFGRAISNIRSMIYYWFKGDGTYASESYELCGSAANNTEPTLSPTSSTGKDTPDDILHIPPVVMGTWIEYIGV